MQVFAFWDVLTMGRVEENSMQCGTAGSIPLPVELHEASALTFDSINSMSLDGQVGPSITAPSVAGRHTRTTLSQEMES